MKGTYKKYLAILMSSVMLSQTGAIVVQAQNYELETSKGSKSDNKEYTEKDLIKYVKKIKKSIKKSKTIKKAKSIIIKGFIKITDFIFYDGEIYGYTYKDLSKTARKKIKKNYYEIDQIIESEYPGYKDELSDDYAKAIKWLKNKSKKLANQAKTKMSDETLNNLDATSNDLKDVGQDLSDVVSTLYDENKVKVKNWYEELKRKSK